MAQRVDLCTQQPRAGLAARKQHLEVARQSGVLGGQVPQLQSEQQQVLFGICVGVVAQVAFGEQAFADQPLELPPAFDVPV